MKKHSGTLKSRRSRQASDGPLRVRLRVDVAPGCAIGPGKIALLERIAREGSLSEAARSLEMSYRRAWILLDDLNRSFAEPVVATAVGGAHGGGARVTGYGMALIKEFRALEVATLRLAARRLRGFAVRQSNGVVPRVRPVSRARRA